MVVVRQTQRLFATACVFSAGLLLGSAAGHGLPRYIVVDLGTFGGDSSSAAGISPGGLVTGRALDADGVSHIFLYDGAMRDLGTYNGNDAYACAVNDNRQIAGYYRVSGTAGSYPYHALFYDGVSMKDIGTLGGSGSMATGINAAGKVAGWSYMYADSLQHDGFLYFDDVLHPMKGWWCDATTIDDSGRVLGYNYIYTTRWMAMAFMHDGTFHYLGTLGGWYSASVAINAAGQICGESYLANGDTHGFIYDGAIHDLGTLGGTYSSATWLNDHGEICGASTTARGTMHGFLCIESTMHDLNDLLDPASQGWIIRGAWAMNNAGQIAGEGIEPFSGQTHAVLLNRAPTCTAFAKPDFNEDCRVDQLDVQALGSCAGGPAVPYATGCARQDLDGDGDVDQVDFGMLQLCYSGLFRAADPGCAD